MPTQRLVLIRHAKSAYPWGVTDHDRPLNERGRRDAPEVGAWLDAHLTWGSPPAVRVSTARRAQLTWGGAWSRLTDRWEAADVRDEARIYDASVATLIEVVAEAAVDQDLTILVGHNPGMADLVAYAGADGPLRDEALVKFPTSAIAVLEVDGPLADSIRLPGQLRVVAFAVPRG